MAKRLSKLRAAETRYIRDALGASRIFSSSDRPAAVDLFISDSLNSALRAQDLARKLEKRIKVPASEAV